MRRLLPSLCAAAALALSSCGTLTNLDSTQLSQQSLGQQPLGTPGSVAAPAEPGAPGALPGSIAGQPAGTVPSVGSGSGSNPGTGGSTGSPNGTGNGTGSGTNTQGPAGRGVTDTTIAIGVPVETGTQAAADAFGIEGASTMSAETITKAVLKDINDHGGVLGRKLVPAFHYYDVATAIANPEQTVAEICADYRDDRPVFAAIGSVPLKGLRDCLAQMGSPFMVLNGISSILQESVYAEHGGNYLYAINSISTERLADLFIESLHARNFDEKWNTLAGGPGIEAVKYGVIHVDMPDINALYDAYARELSKYGHRFEETVTYPNDAQQALAATNSAVLRFKQTGVTHVFGASAFFLQAAESQGYRPRYAYLPGLGQFGVENVPAAQMRGALTVGWAPTNDVDGTKDPGDTPGAKRCRATMARAGLAPGNRSDLELMYNVCDGLYSLRDALARGGSPSVAGLRVGFEGLGAGFGPALTFRALVGPGRHSGVHSVRDMAFDEDCGCLYYTSRSDRS